MDDASRRLVQLARILSEARPYDAAASVAVEDRDQARQQRIERLTAHLDHRVGRDIDAVDEVAMRLLLDEYAAMMAPLRTAAQEGATILERLAAAVRTDRHLLDRRLEEQAKRSVSTAPSDRQPPSRSPGT